MANSGNFTTNSSDGRSLTFSWSLSSQSIANNTSTISWQLVGSGSASGWVKAGNFKVTIDGATVYSSTTRINLYNGTVVASGSYTFTHDNNGNKSFTAYAEAGIYYVAVNCSGSGTWSLPQIARYATISTAPNFMDTQNPTITFSNPAGFPLQLKIEAGGDVSLIVRDRVTTTSPYTFILTSEERALLLSKTPNSNTLTVRFTVGTYINGVVSNWSYLDRTMTVTNANPTIGALTYADTNSETTAITSNNQLIIQNKSRLTFTATNFTALKSASLASYTISIGGITQTASLSGSSVASITANFGTVNLSSNTTATITLTDSRGNKATKTVNVTFLAWSAPTALISLVRKSGYYSDTDLTVNAEYASLNNLNAITIQYRYKLADVSAWGAWTTIANDTTTTISLDNQSQWSVQVSVIDMLGSTVYNLIVDRGVPIIFFDRVKNSVSINCFPEDNESLEVNGLRLDDKIYIGSQQIYDYYETSTSGENVVACAYDYRLIRNVFAGIAIPDNYERAYKITFQYSTQNSNVINVKLNNITSNNCNTWSNDKFRDIGGTRLFKESELVLETTSGYSRDGLNLSVSNSGSYTAKVWAITIHGYLVNKDTNLDISTYNIPDVTPTPA